ncbi:MAG: hypothetical protein KJZ93_17720 [Caldilineaceae bacterium]|nr:hypothetical protein [Caldilineaceae bacterium]
MKTNPVANCTLIIRSQVEYSAATQTVVLRCLLEKVATGQRRGFIDIDDLLVALRAELMELQNQILPPDAQNSENAARMDFSPTTPDAAP